MFPYYIAIGRFGRMPVRGDKMVALADARVLGEGATVKGIMGEQARRLMAQDNALFAIVANAPLSSTAEYRI